jgi:hypothetical protein
MPASWTIYGLRGIWTVNDAGRVSVHPRTGGASKERLNGRKLVCVTPTETAILIWLAVGAGIAGGVFIVARSAVQIGSVAYRVMEKQLSGGAATRQTVLLTGAMIAAIIVTAFIAGYAIFAVFGSLLDSSGLLTNTTTNGT